MSATRSELILKALAAADNNVPFYTALPSSTFDWKMRDGVREVPIEQRDGTEVRYIQGLHEGQIKQVLLTPEASAAANYAFDVTPARLVTGLITERGICAASEEGVRGFVSGAIYERCIDCKHQSAGTGSIGLVHWPLCGPFTVRYDLITVFHPT